MIFLLTSLPERPAWWDVAWSTWALVLVGTAAALLAQRTLSDIRKQTINSKIAADSALLNAQAVINAERAWVIAELVPLCTKLSDGRWYRRVADNWAQLSNEEIMDGY